MPDPADPEIPPQPLTDPMVPPMRDPPAQPFRDPVLPPPATAGAKPMRDPDSRRPIAIRRSRRM